MATQPASSNPAPQAPTAVASPTMPQSTLPSMQGLPSMNTPQATPGKSIGWTDQLLVSGGFAQGVNTPMGGQGYASYNGQIMTSQDAEDQYQKDLAAWQHAAQEHGHALGLQALGETPPVGESAAPGAQPQAPGSPAVDQMVNQFMSQLDPNDLTNLQRNLQAGGFLTAKSYQPGVLDPGTAKAFGNLLLQTNDALSNDPSATWQTVLKNAVDQSGWQVNAAGDMTRTISRTPSINPASAQAAITNLIGRRASDSEIQNFVAEYNKNIAGQLDTTETLTKAGVDTTTQPTYATQSQTVQDAELQAARTNPDYATYQAATTYWNAMQQALGAQGSVENNLR